MGKNTQKAQQSSSPEVNSLNKGEKNSANSPSPIIPNHKRNQNQDFSNYDDPIPDTVDPNALAASRKEAEEIFNKSKSR